MWTGAKHGLENCVIYDTVLQPKVYYLYKIYNCLKEGGGVKSKIKKGLEDIKDTPTIPWTLKIIQTCSISFIHFKTFNLFLVFSIV